MIEVQIITAFFVLFALSRVYLRFKERKLSSPTFLFWNLIWIAGLVLIFFPDLSTKLARLVGIGRGVDAIIYTSIAVLFYLIFRIYVKIEDTQRQITEVARKVALKSESSKK